MTRFPTLTLHEYNVALRKYRITDNDNIKKINAWQGGLQEVEQVAAQANLKSSQAVTAANDAKSTADSLNTEVDAIVQRETDSDAMSRQAAVGADGTDYVVLKTRLDQEHTDVSAQLAVNGEVFNQTKSSEEVDVFLVYGQSNARGYAYNTPGDPEYKTDKVTVWDGAQEIPLTNYMPTQNDSTSTGGAWVAFANEYARKTGRTAIIANCAKGSQSMAELSKGAATTNYSGLVQWGSDIKAHIANKGKTVGKTVILWCQGERDSMDETPTTEYKTGLATLWSDIKADLGADVFAVFTVGYYNDSRKIYAWAIQSIQRKFAQENTDVIVAFDDIESMNAHGMKVDGVHLNQVGYNYMGEQGAKALSSTLLTDFSFQQDEFIKRQGVINLDGSQEWKYYGGWLNGPDFQPSISSSRAVTNIINVSVEEDHVAITLADKVDYILGVGATVKSYQDGSPSNGTSGVQVHFDRGIYSDEDAEGRTVVKLYFVANLTARVKMAEQTIDTALFREDLSSMFSVEWSTGMAYITHPRTDKISTATLRTTTPYFLSCYGVDTSTRIRTWDASGTEANAEVVASFQDILIPPSMFSSSMELTFHVIGTEKTES